MVEEENSKTTSKLIKEEIPTEQRPVKATTATEVIQQVHVEEHNSNAVKSVKMTEQLPPFRFPDQFDRASVQQRNIWIASVLGQCQKALLDLSFETTTTGDTPQ